MDLEVNRLESMGFEFAHSKNGTVIPPKTTDVAYQKQQGISDITYKKRDDSALERNKGALVVAPAKMSLELPKAKSYDASDLFGQNDSLSMTYSRVQGKKAKMDELLQEILKKNAEQAVLSEKIDDKSKEAAKLDKDVSGLEYKSQMNGVYAQSVGAVIGSAVALFGGLGGAGFATGAQIGSSVVHTGLEWLHGNPKLKAAAHKYNSDSIKADVQLMRDEQGRISTEISVLQNRFSMESQSYSMFISIMQTIISAFNDAKRAITVNMR